jgi:hypothetical protein
MKDMIRYSIQRDVTHRTLQGITILEETPYTIKYMQRGGRVHTLNVPPNDDVLISIYGGMIMDGYTLTLSPDSNVYLCSGGKAVYSVTFNSCTCPAYMYGGESTVCKHMHMLQGHAAYSNKAMGLRKSAVTLGG